MSLENFRMLIYEFLKKYPGIVPEEAPLDILDSKSAFLCLRMVRIPITQGTLLEEDIL